MKTNFTMLPGFGRAFRNWAFLLGSLLLPVLGYAQVPVVISEVYGGGGTAAGAFTNDFVELYNPNPGPISLAGYSVQYKAPTTTTGAYAMAALLGTTSVNEYIPGNGFYLVQLYSAGATGAAMPTADATGNTDLNATGGRIALVNGITALPLGSTPATSGVVDFVGYGTAITSEGSPAPAATTATSIERKARANSTSATMSAGGIDANQGNGYDSNNNSTDFLTRATPEPQNSASTPEVFVPAAVYYNTKNPGGTLDDLSTYSTTLDGAGPSPANFTAAFQTFNISGTGNTLAANLTVTGTGSKVVLQTGATFTVPATTNFTGPLDLSSGATLVEENASPAYTPGVIDANSTIEFAQASAFTVPLLAAPGYGNLTLRNATKQLDAGTTVVRGTLLVDNVSTFGGTGLSSILNLNGNLSLTNTVGFSPTATATDRISLVATNLATPQVLNGGGNTIKLFKLTLVTNQAGVSLTDGTSNLELGTSTAGGGYMLGTNAVLSVGNNTLSFAAGGRAAITGPTTPGQLALSPGSSLVFSKNNTAAVGTLRLTAGSTQLTNLTVDLAGNNNTITLPANLTITGTLTLTTGTLAIGAAHQLTLTGPVATATGLVNGTATSDLVIAGSGSLGLSNFSGSLGSLTLDRPGATLALSTDLTTSVALNLANGTLDIGTSNILNVNGTVTTTGTGLLSGTSTASLRIAGSGALGTVAFSPTGGVLNTLVLNRPGGTLTLVGGALQVTTLTLTSGVFGLGAGVGLTITGPLVVADPTVAMFAATPSSLLSFTGTGAIGDLAFVPGQDQLQGLTLNRATGTIPTAQLLTTLTVNTLTLTRGRLFVQGASKLIVLPSGSVSNGGASGYVNTLTQATITNNTTPTVSLTFPLGVNGQYHPLSLTVTDQVIGTTSYTAHQYEAPSPVRTLPASLARVSQIRYYNLVAEPGGTSTLGTATIRLSYDATDRVTPANVGLLRVAMTDPADATKWRNAGGTGGGTDITSDPFPAGPLGDFTLATDILTPPNTNPLPVELVRFEAVRQASGVNVSWATATEKNSAYFDVQRSLDGREFATVATATAGGNTTQPTVYAALDKTAPLARLYYRLRQVDLDGTLAYSPVVAVAGSGTSAELLLYPNPTTDRLTATLPAAEGRTYRVLNSLGQVLAHGSAALADPVVDVRQLPAGTYFLELRTEAGQQTRRFVKND